MNTLPSKKRAFWILIFLGFIFVVPIIAAHLAYRYGSHYFKLHTTNYGTLVQPPLPIEKLIFNDGKGKWQLFYIFLAPECQDFCKKRLFFMRQIQLALGKEGKRLINRFITLSSHALPLNEKELKARLKVYCGQVSLQMLKSFFNHNASASMSGFYLVDPLGNLIMAYPQDENPDHILKDLKRLLRASRIG